MNPLTLHFHPLSSYCHKVLIALDELGVQVDRRLLNLGDPAERQAFLALWPLGKMPLLVDQGRPIPETTIIIEHVQRHHAAGAATLIPEDADEALAVRGCAPVSRNALAAALLKEMHALLAAYGSGGFAPLADEWRALDLVREQPVRVQTVAAVAAALAAVTALFARLPGRRFFAGGIAAGEQRRQPHHRQGKPADLHQRMQKLARIPRRAEQMADRRHGEVRDAADGGSGSCTTSLSTGSCRVTSSTLNNRSSSTEAKVTQVSGAYMVYDSSQNSVTAIRISK